MIYVVGDKIIDKYITGTSNRLSPEAPVPVMTNLIEYSLEGGALNVYNNIRVPKQFVLHPDYVSPIKTRIVCNGKQVVRIDDEKSQSLNPTIPNNRFVVISDYNKGAISDTKSIIKNASYSIVDPKRDFENFIGCNVMKCNREEFEKYYKYPFNQANLKECREYLQSDVVIVTDSSHGVHIYDNNGYEHQTIKNVNVVDVTGAGDVFLAVLSSCLFHLIPLRNACKIASKAATLSVTKMGTYVLNDEEYENCFH